MPSPSERLVLAHLGRYNRLRATAGATVGALWDRYARLDDPEPFASRAATVATASQGAAAAQVAGYVSALLTVAGEPSPPTASGAAVGAAVRNGTDPVDVYTRGIVTARAAIANGSPFVAAMAAGRARMVATAETDVALAQRSATVTVLQGNPRVVGYRRVLTGQSCALCALASSQRYRTSELMPIHAHCDCGVAPIIGSSDPGQVINRPLVDNVKNARRDDPNRRLTVADDGTVELPRVAVRDHGELGPVLTDASHEFTGPDDIAA